jgi:hypothetical protein
MPIAMGTLAQLREAGKIRWYGISTNDREAVDRLRACGPLDVLQIVYNQRSRNARGRGMRFRARSIVRAFVWTSRRLVRGGVFAEPSHGPTGKCQDLIPSTLVSARYTRSGSALILISGLISTVDVVRTQIKTPCVPPPRRRDDRRGAFGDGRRDQCPYGFPITCRCA